MGGNNTHVLSSGDGLQNGARALVMRMLADAGSYQYRCVAKQCHCCKPKPRTLASRSSRILSINGAKSSDGSPSCTSNPFSSTRSAFWERVRRKIPSARTSRSSKSPANRRKCRLTCCGRTKRPALSMDTAFFMVSSVPNGSSDVNFIRVKKFGVRRQAVFRATPLFERSAAAMLRAKAVPRSAHSAALVTALQISRLRVFAEHCSQKSLRLVDQAAVSLEHLALVSQRRRPDIQREAALSAPTG